ncbi:hypothetical protein J5N97_024051 [Dioscorea zingiberensis]|uniref:Uncharacterized protein n=1 Tax=Dioscorea zingiberensis TaxID=325984 RepID=A0A9D5C6F1_9LILI|nr:hypothetical protein J5N97_024051 [Dioscorea zingiberensis]
MHYRVSNTGGSLETSMILLYSEESFGNLAKLLKKESPIEVYVEHVADDAHTSNMPTAGQGLSAGTNIVDKSVAEQVGSVQDVDGTGPSNYAGLQSGEDAEQPSLSLDSTSSENWCSTSDDDEYMQIKKKHKEMEGFKVTEQQPGSQFNLDDPLEQPSTNMDEEVEEDFSDSLAFFLTTSEDNSEPEHGKRKKSTQSVSTRKGPHHILNWVAAAKGKGKRSHAAIGQGEHVDSGPPKKKEKMPLLPLRLNMPLLLPRARVKGKHLLLQQGQDCEEKGRHKFLVMAKLKGKQFTLSPVISTSLCHASVTAESAPIQNQERETQVNVGIVPIKGNENTQTNKRGKKYQKHDAGIGVQTRSKILLEASVMNKYMVDSNTKVSESSKK